MSKNLLFIPIAVLLIAALPLPLPYGYYVFLRILVSVAAVAYIIDAYSAKQEISGWVVALGMCGIIFNPIIPLHLTRTIWMFLNIGGIGLFAAYWYFPREK